METNRTKSVPSAPAVADAMAILNLLRDQKETPLGLSEIARALRLSKASCYRILQTLQTGAFVVQNPQDKSYTLGPALIPLGQAAAGDANLLRLIQSTLVSLATRNGYHIGAWKRTEDDHIVLIAQAGSPHLVHLAYASGQRVPARPPLGTTFFAWADPAEVERWLDGYYVNAQPLDPPARAAYRQYLSQVRARGYSCTLSVDGRSEAGCAELRTWLARAAEVGLWPHRSEVAGDLIDPSVRTDGDLVLPVPVVTIAAPIFDYAGRAAFNLALTGFANHIAPEDVPALGQEVRAAANNITVATGGVAPDSTALPASVASSVAMSRR